MTATPDPLAPLTTLDGVPEALEEAREAVAAVHRHPANRRGWDTTSAEAALRAARASAALAGADVVLGTSGEVTDLILAGALRVGGVLHGEPLERAVAVWTRAPLQELARLHVLAAARDGEEADTGADGLGRPRAVPGVSERLQGLAALICGGTTAPAPIVAAVVHGELATLEPFGSMDAVVARAASRLVCVSTGFDPHGLGVPEVLWNRDQRRYAAALEGFAGGTAEGLGEWICYCCEAFVDGAREARAIADAAV